MMRVVGAVVIIAVGCFSGTTIAGGVDMEPGLWEITTVVEMTGMPVHPPPRKSTHCYTEEEINRAGVVPEQQGDCAVTDLQQAGNKMTWKVVCTGESQGEGEGEIVFQDSRSYEGKMRFESQGMTMASKYTARRVGECQ